MTVAPSLSTATNPPHLTVRLLGDFALIADDTPINLASMPRLQALLTYLLLHRQAPQSRRQLAFLFWPDSTEAQALTNLRKQLLYLRQLLPQADRLLVADRQSVQWLPAVAFTLDVETFRTALAAATTAPVQQAVMTLRAAIAAYAGELLPGCYDEWIFAEREALHTQYGHALERLIQLLETQRAYTEAIVYSEQLLRHDPLHEATYRRLMRLHARNDDRAAALRVYHTCLTQLREELGVDPDEETQQVYARLLEGTSVAPLQPELAAHAPFVGRQMEWQMLQQRWLVALQGQPQFVLIAGESGIGKTRLAEELLRWALHQGFCTLRSRCYAAEGRLAYAPIIEWLRAEPLRPTRTKVAAAWLSELSRLLPELLSDQPTLPPPAPITQGWQRHHLFEAVTRALLVIDQPLVLLIDDLQWCDKETLELLHFLLRNATCLGQPKLLLPKLMIVGTARLPDEVDATHPLHDLLNPLRGSDTLTQLDLLRLSQAETSDLAHQMTAQTLDGQTLHQLFHDTAGNPLFVVETMRATQGQLTRNGAAGNATTTAILPIEASAAIVQQLPPKVLAVIQARLGQLSATARELCEWGAIVGRAFTLDLLIAAGKISPDQAVNALDELWQRRIIREQGTDAYDFSHDRIRDVAAAGISRARRKYLHRCMAETLANENTDQFDKIAAQIAAHYDAAGIVEKAIDYYAKAADRSAQIYATAEIIHHLQRALTLLKLLPASKARDQRELALLVTLGPPLADVTNFAVTLMHDTYERAYQLSQQLGIPLHPSMLRVWAIHKTSRRNFVDAKAMGQQLLEIAGQQITADDQVVYLEGCYVIGVSAFWQGDFMQSSAYLQQVVDGYAKVCQARHLIEYGQDTGIYCRTRLGWTLWALGYPDQARQQCAASLVLAKQLQHPFTLSLAVAYSAICACADHDANRAETVMHMLFAADSPASARKGSQFGFLDGWILLLRGKIEESIQQLVEHTNLQRSTRPEFTSFPLTLTLLAEAYLCAGDYEPALAILAEAFAALNGNQAYWCIAEMYRIKGALLLGQGREVAEAEACFLQALAISRRQAAKSLELRAAMSMARLWAQQGKQREAHTLLAEIYGWFTEGFDTADLQEAQALLEHLR